VQKVYQVWNLRVISSVSGMEISVGGLQVSAENSMCAENRTNHGACPGEASESGLLYD